MPDWVPSARRGSDPHVEAQHLSDDLAALVGPDAEGGADDAARDARGENGHEVGPGLGVRRQVRERARVEDGQKVPAIRDAPPRPQTGCR